MSSPQTQSDAVRRFGRFYTRQIALLGEGLLHSPFSLTEARVLYELATRDGPNASEIGRDLGLDAGYLSRILKSFTSRSLTVRSPSDQDGRRSVISLTQAGREAFQSLDDLSRQQAESLLAGLSITDRQALVDAMTQIERLLDQLPPDLEIHLRRHRIGDVGWIARRQGLLYAEEYGWDETFEALVAEILAAFVKAHDPARERAWVAERAGDIVGSVFLVRQSDAVAKLRLLFVEPAARGTGLGATLVKACIAFAREAGYETLTLWTNDILTAARRIYQAEGFVLVAEAPHRSFGADLVGQTWSLDL